MGHGDLGPIVSQVDNPTAAAFAKNEAKRSKLHRIDARQWWVQALSDREVCDLVN